MQSWSVGILCFNEVHTIKAVIEKTLDVLNVITPEYEVVVVDDGSTDGSTQVIGELAASRKQVIPVIHNKNKGMGAGLHSVYNSVRFQNVVVIAGDGQFDISEIIPFKIVPEGSFVSFYREEKTTYNFFRKSLTNFNRWLNKHFIGIDLKDFNWAKIYKNEDLQQLHLEIKSSLVESEICAKLIYLGRTPVQVASMIHPRTHGRSKGSFSKMVKQALLETFTLIKVMNRFKRKHKSIAQ